MKKYLLLFLPLLCTLHLSAQDEHFSQFYALPIHINPALTGAYEGTYRMTMIYRDQWNNQLESPYKTFAAGGDTNFKIRFGKLKTKDHFGLGVFFINDRVAEFQANTNQVSAYFAYHKSLSDKRKSFLGIGVKMGIVQKNINYDNLTFQDQFNQIDGFEGITSESLPPNNFGVMDLSVGLNYFTVLNKNTYYAGLAIHHFNQPNISFFNRIENPNPSIDISQSLAPKYTAHVSLDRKINIKSSIQPRLVYQRQAEDNQLDVGTNFEYTLENQRSAIIFGIWGTFLDDLRGPHLENITPLVGLRQGLFIFGLSYDIHMQDALSSPFGLNTLELSIRFSGIHSNESNFCPTF